MFYGNQWDRLEFETHRYLFSLSELVTILTGLGYQVTSADHRPETHIPGRDMRVIAVK